MPKSNAQFIDQISMGVQIVDPEMRYLYLNNTLLASIQMTSKDVIGKKMTEVFPGFDGTDMYHKISQCMKDKMPAKLFNEFSFPDGRRTFHELTLERIKEGVIIFSRDITNTIEGETLLQESNLKLEQKVQARTIKLADLNKALKKEKLNSIQNAKLAALGEVVAGIAHEINNPLAVVIGCAKHLSQVKNDEEKFEKRIDSIMISATRIEKIVRGLSRFAKRDTDAARETFSVNTIVQNALLIASVKAARSGIQIIEQSEPNLFVKCVPVEIEQALINLLSNAIDATSSEERKRVQIKVFAEDGKVVFQVKNSGPKISKEVESSMFDPFFTTKGAQGRTGLGLSITKGILDSHGGEIILNRRSKHTCFEIRLNEVEAPQEELNAA